MTKTIKDLDLFTQGYITCALWSSNDESDESGGSPIDANYSFEDISEETLKVIIEDCKSFQNKNNILLESYYESLPIDYAGHDFWLTRNGHGAGFWDRDYPQSKIEDLGEKLTEACKEFKEVSLYIGDDKKIYA